MMSHFEHERRLEVKQAFADLEKTISVLREEDLKTTVDVNILKQKYENIHKEKTEKHYEIFKRLDTVDLKIDGDGNSNEGLIRKMDTLKVIPNLIKSNTNTMRWTIGIMVTANLAMFAAVISIVKHGL